MDSYHSKGKARGEEDGIDGVDGGEMAWMVKRWRRWRGWRGWRGYGARLGALKRKYLLQ